MNRLFKLLAPFACLLFADHGFSQDWTQWGGANRDFRVVTDIAGEIEFKETWRRELGPGYSGILVENERLYTMYRQDDDEVIICMDAASGSTVWEHRYSAPLSKDADQSFGKGPNSTPILVDDLVLAIGFNADLHCLEKETGKERWRLNLIKDLEGTVVDFGYSQSPIVYGGNLILPLGGAGKGIVAISVDDGSVVWSAQDFNNSYATPVLATVDGLDQMIFVMTDEVISIDPGNGNLFWDFPLKNEWSTHAFVPLWHEETSTLFVSSFRQSHGLRLTRTAEGRGGFEKIWSVEKIGVGFSNGLIVNGIAIGTTGGTRTPLLTGIEIETGEVLWRKRGFGVSNFLAIGDRVLLLDENGKLAVGKPTKSDFSILQETEILSSPKAWTAPTQVGNRLYLRDQKELVRLDLN